ncbi:MAG TPA: diaminopimelate epimerase [Candidatus Pullilachnospira intestinigallinarum]|nr:diaminopimelate epimerase [Candidatus Pullilachnospira intestinigallinarum]
MKFTKMQGIGNDYVYVNCFQEKVEHPEEVAVKVSDRHFGVGSDGLILIKPSDVADFEMDMYNADGSRGAMCGNGIRCVAKYVYDYGLTDKTTITVNTGSGVKTLELTVEDGKVSRVRVNMGAPQLQPGKIPMKAEGDRAVDYPIWVGDREYRITAVSMGNPHAVTCVPDVDGLEIEKIGPLFEHHPLFPDRVNTEFIRVLDRHTVQMRVWERGSGETLACGTGACAVAVACILNGLTEERVTVKLLGGDLEIFWDRDTNQVYMTGPAAVVFDGEIDLEA